MSDNERDPTRITPEYLTELLRSIDPSAPKITDPVTDRNKL
ncbi:hypothetical protein [Demequina sp. NBRC 110054]|nr:hypothetical protein [Demequina sp. NBRC 110054]